jgi:hypothetical protein
MPQLRVMRGDMRAAAQTQQMNLCALNCVVTQTNAEGQTEHEQILAVAAGSPCLTHGMRSSRA